MPEEEQAELALIYQAKGLAPEAAASLAERLLSDRTTALDTLAREELGIDPQELGGSAWEAGLMSFLLFTVGAAVPVLPYLFLSGIAGIAVSAGPSLIALFVIGAAITLMTGRGVLYSGFRQVGFGLAAAAITFGVGGCWGCSWAGEVTGRMGEWGSGRMREWEESTSLSRSPTPPCSTAHFVANRYVAPSAPAIVPCEVPWGIPPGRRAAIRAAGAPRARSPSGCR